MSLQGLSIGIGLTGSHCTFDQVIPRVEEMVNQGAQVYPYMSPEASQADTRFGAAAEWKERIARVTGKEPVTTMVGAEPVGPQGLLDVMVIVPCTGNTLAKLAGGITDTAVLMAAKAQLRNLKPVVLAISTNDGLGINARNIGILINMKNIFLVPFGQDNPDKKANSLVARLDYLIPALEFALQGKQIQPVLVQHPGAGQGRQKTG